MNQMSAPARWWNHINIWWCIAGCRAFETWPQSWHRVQSTLSHQRREGRWIYDSLRGKWTRQTAKTNNPAEWVGNFSPPLPQSFASNKMPFEFYEVIIAMDINIICNLGFESVLDFISEILLIHILNYQQSIFENGLENYQNPTTSQLLIRSTPVISKIKTVPRLKLKMIKKQK